MWGAIAGAVAGQALGSMMQGGANYYFSKELAKLQFEHQKEMMQNAHQWEVQDLRKAGLNPILSAGGSGASGSAAAPVVSANGGNPVSSAMALKTAREQQLLLQDQQAKTRAETKAAEALALNYSSSAMQNIANARLADQSMLKVARENRYWDANPGMYNQKMVDSSVSGPMNQFFNAGAFLQNTFNELFGGKNSAKSLR